MANHQDDPLPAMRAELDQALMMAPEVARMARGLFEAFQTEGFDSKQVLYLTACQVLDKPGYAG
jgi:hypothetical protein